MMTFSHNQSIFYQSPLLHNSIHNSYSISIPYQCLWRKSWFSLNGWGCKIIHLISHDNLYSFGPPGFHWYKHYCLKKGRSCDLFAIFWSFNLILNRHRYKMISALLLIDAKGKNIVSRYYRYFAVSFFEWIEVTWQKRVPMLSEQTLLQRRILEAILLLRTLTERPSSMSATVTTTLSL